jgi:hypothetical protein
MTVRPKFKLSRLREIGWSRWDPIGLNGLEDWPDDEYDDYLLQAAGMLWNGAHEDEVVGYLVSIETGHMGLEDVPGIRERARETVGALGQYVVELRADRGAEAP